jgi:phosphoserine aminotransferase
VRVFNFAAGPATLPAPVLEQVRDELLDWQGCGASVMEVSHRSKPFMDVARESEALLRNLLGVPDSYRVLFLQGGARAQFAAVPLNLAQPGASADYLNTGIWSKLAIAEAERFLAHVHLAADEAASGYSTVPAPQALRLTGGAAYLHYTANETIGGVEFHHIPDSAPAPLVADMSSTLLSRPLPVEKFGLIYAGAQKNLGPAGLTVVIVRAELLGRARPGTPAVWDYRKVADEGSMLNTPPVFAWYVAALVLRWIKAQGGLEAMAQRNRAKSQLLYQSIDASGFYANAVPAGSRSWMNVPFRLPSPALEAQFTAAARAAGLINLEGHRAVGGLRASLYNAMPLAGVEALVAFMKEFERRHG